VGRKGKGRAEVTASIGQAVQRGLEMLDSFRGEPTGWRELQRESRNSEMQARRAQRTYAARKSQAQTLMIAGTAVGASTGTIGVIDLLATSSGEFWWFALAAAGAVAGAIGARSWRRLAPPAPVTPIEAPPATVRRGAIGHESVVRYTAVRVQVVQVARAIESLHTDAAAEIRSADAQVAPTLNALAERLRVLDEMSRRMPGTTTAETALTSARAVSEQLDHGSAAYDVLLAAAARLLAEPDIGRPAPAILEPASSALIAYAHGLHSASQL
jgi:hypothetical protein